MTDSPKTAASPVRPRRGISWWVLLVVAGVIVATPFVLGAVFAVMIHGRW
ncbi:MAG TPA: hypothetical protein VF265_07280 [Nevskiaceae bacterium]